MLAEQADSTETLPGSSAPLLGSSSRQELGTRLGSSWRRAGIALLLVTACLCPVSIIWNSRTNASAKAPNVAMAGTSKVRVDVYGMAGCPFTRDFFEGPLSEAMENAGDLIDLRLYAFGNCYYPTKQCGGTAHGMDFVNSNPGYNRSARECWDQLCGAAAAIPAEDCFSGPVICQHGFADSMVTTAWACAKENAGGSGTKLMPFVRCSALQFLSVTTETSFRKLITACAEISGLDGDDVVACASGARGKQLFQAEGRATIPHPTTPHALVAGKQLQDTRCDTCADGIMYKVCESWRAMGGEDTPACRAIFQLI